MNLNLLISELAKDAVDKVVPRPLNSLLKYFIIQLAEQEKLLKRIEDILVHHVTNPFKTGLVYLEEAEYTSNYELKKEFIKKALDSFVSVSQLDNPQLKLFAIKAQFYIGICYSLLSDTDFALRWYKKSYQTAVAFENSLLNNNSKKINLKWYNTIYKSNYKYCEIRYQVGIFLNAIVRFFQIVYPNLDILISIKDPSLIIDPIGSIAFLPNGDSLVDSPYQMFNSGIFLCDTVNGKKITKISKYSANKMTLSPNGCTLIGTISNIGVKMWNIQSNKELTIYDDRRNHLSAKFVFTPDSKYFLSYYYDNQKREKKLNIFNLNGEIINQNQIPILKYASITDCAFSPDGKILAIITRLDKYLIWQLTFHIVNKEFEELNKLELRPHETPKKICYSNNGSYLAICYNYPGVVTIWDTKNNNEIFQIESYSKSNGNVCFFADDKFIITIDSKGYLQFWNLKDGKETYRYKVTGDYGFDHPVVVSPDGFLIAVSVNIAVKLLEVRLRIKSTSNFLNQTSS